MNPRQLFFLLFFFSSFSFSAIGADDLQKKWHPAFHLIHPAMTLLANDLQKKWHPILATPIESIDWNIHIKNALSSEGIRYVGALIKKTEVYLLKIPPRYIFWTQYGSPQIKKPLYASRYLNRQDLNEINGWLHEKGLSLGMNKTWWPSDWSLEEKLVKVLSSQESGKEERIQTLAKGENYQRILLYPIDKFADAAVRLPSVLKVNGIYYFYELIEQTEAALLRMPGISYKSLIEILAFLNSFGPSLSLNQQLDGETLYTLGVKFYEGEGVGKSHFRAADLWDRAAKLGHIEATYSLAYLHSKGEGIKKDMQEAIKLWTRAAEKGHEESKRSLKDRCASSYQ